MQEEEGERQKRESLEPSTSREAGSPSAPPIRSLLTPPQRPVPPTQAPSQPRQPSHINFHLQQMAALLAAGASSSLGAPRPSPPLPAAEAPAPAPKRLRLTPPPTAVEGAVPAASLPPVSTPPVHLQTPDPIALLPPGALYPAPVDLLSQVGPAVVESGYTHAVVSLELLRMLDWRARRSFVAEREAQRAVLRRSTEPAALGGPSAGPGESGSAAEFIARVSQRIPSLASTQPSSASTALHLASAGSSPSGVTLLGQLKALASGLGSGPRPSTTAPPMHLHERGVRLQPARPASEQSPFEQSHRARQPAFTPPLTRRESAPPSALETLAGLLQAEGAGVPPAPPPLLPPARQQTETENIVSALTSLLSALIQQQEPPPRRSDPSPVPPE